MVTLGRIRSRGTNVGTTPSTSRMPYAAMLPPDGPFSPSESTSWTTISASSWVRTRAATRTRASYGSGVPVAALPGHGIKFGDPRSSLTCSEKLEVCRSHGRRVFARQKVPGAGDDPARDKVLEDRAIAAVVR